MELRILNIGFDRDLLKTGDLSEAQKRQSFYCEMLPARIVHIVKAESLESTHIRRITSRLTVIPCPVRHWIFFIPKVLFLASSLLRKEKFDLIQVQEPFASGIVGLTLAKIFNKPLVVGLYSDEIDNPEWLKLSPLNYFANFIGKNVLKFSSGSRTDSLAIKHKLDRYQFPNLTFIPFLITNAESLSSKSEVAKKLRINLLAKKKGPLCIAVCRLEQEKNIFLMLDSIARVSEKNPEIVLAIAGSGTLYSKLVNYSNALNAGTVIWLGKVNHVEMPDYYQAADILLLSSNRESAARVLYESLLAGTPVLSTDTAGAREVVTDGLSGRIVPVGDLNAFSEALFDLSQDLLKLSKIGEVGKNAMLGLVAPSAVIKSMKNLYETAIKKFQ